MISRTCVRVWAWRRSSALMGARASAVVPADGGGGRIATCEACDDVGAVLLHRVGARVAQHAADDGGDDVAVALGVDVGRDHVGLAAQVEQRDVAVLQHVDLVGVGLEPLDHGVDRAGADGRPARRPLLGELAQPVARALHNLAARVVVK
eukprot:6172325-Pleurochrysis_carterae.AAC.1